MQISDTTTITITAIALLISVAIALYNWVTSVTNKARIEGETHGTISTKLDTIIVSIAKISDELVKLQNGMHEILRRVDKLEERVSALERKKSPTKPKMDTFE